MSVSERLDGFQQRHRWAGFPLAVIYKFTEDQGTYLAALITYYGFVAMFPMLLLLASILGFVLQGDPDLQVRILNSTLAQFPIIGDQLGAPQGLRGSGAALVVGSVGALYGASGVAQAMQNAMNVAWAVPRHRRPNPIKSRLRSLIVIVIGGSAVLATTILSVLGSSAAAYGADIGRWSSILLVAAAVALNSAVVIGVFRTTTSSASPVRDLLPGAITAAVIWQLLQVFGGWYVGRVVKGAGVTYGVFAVVLGLLAWIFLAATGFVLSAEINVVRAKRLYPRALLTPFTDDVDLTNADRHVYAEAATAQTFKGFEEVEVSFDESARADKRKRRLHRPRFRR
jgi:YihY family inner membrane protein